MKLNWKLLLPVFCGAALLLLQTGCGGLYVTKSISPATFLLPGLLENDPPPVHPDDTLPAVEPSTQSALVLN